jgi:hypothetical protein
MEDCSVHKVALASRMGVKHGSTTLTLPTKVGLATITIKWLPANTRNSAETWYDITHWGWRWGEQRKHWRLTSLLVAGWLITSNLFHHRQSSSLSSLECICIQNMDWHFFPWYFCQYHNSLVYSIHYHHHIISHRISSHQILNFSEKEVWLGFMAIKFMVLTMCSRIQKQAIS